MSEFRSADLTVLSGCWAVMKVSLVLEELLWTSIALIICKSLTANILFSNIKSGIMVERDTSTAFYILYFVFECQGAGSSPSLYFEYFMYCKKLSNLFYILTH